MIPSSNAQTVSPGLYYLDVDVSQSKRTPKVLQFESRPSASPLNSADAESGQLRYPVVWWDPVTLRLDVDAHFGIRQEELLSKDAPEATVRRDLSRYDGWKRSRDAAVARAAEPSLVVRLVTEQAEHDSIVPDVEIIQLPVAGDRPSGMRFGSLLRRLS